MRYLTIRELKQQVNIDPQWTGDDQYLMHLGDAAEGTVEGILDTPLEMYLDDDNMLPDGILHAMMMLVATWFNDRESSTHSGAVKHPEAVDFLLAQYKNYGQKHFLKR